MTLTLKSRAQFMAVYTALHQYVENTSEMDTERDLTADGRAELAAAEEILGRFDAVMCSLAN